MLGVHLAEEQLVLLLPGKLDLATVNAPRLCVVSGPEPAIHKFKVQLEHQHIKCSWLHTSHAYHSRMIEPIMAEFQAHLEQIILNRPVIPFVSNLTGQWTAVEQVISPAYWTRHLREPVRFSLGVQEILKKEPHPLWMEIGPGNVLGSLVRQHQSLEKNIQPAAAMMVNMVRHPKEKVSDLYHLLTQVGQLWLYGKSIDWSVFTNEKKHHRISLPTYSFEKYLYPLEGIEFKVGKEMRGRQLSSRRKADIADWFYVPLWERSLLPSLSTAEEKPGEKDNPYWLVLSDAGHFDSRLLQQLKQKKQRLVMVKPGDGFSRENPFLYVIDPRDEGSYEKLFKALQEDGKTPGKIIFCRGITHDTGQDRKTMSRWHYLDLSLNLAFYSLLYMVQALGKLVITHDIQLVVVTDGMQEVTGDEWLFPEKALVLGAIKVISREYANITCSSIDIVLPEAGSPEEDRLIHQLTAELLTDISQPVVAWRGNYRWIPTIKPHPLPANTNDNLAPVFKQQGVYLVTGGLGGIGFTLAEYLARNYNARLVLIGRSVVPSGEEAQQWLETHDSEDPVSDKIKKIRQLEALGAVVLVVSADVADLQQMETAVTGAEKQLGPINGVVHAAGLADYGGVIQRRTKKMTQSVLAAKVHGTLVLDEVFQQRKLDFFVMCSSISSLVGPFGQVGYTAANAFLDAFALYRTNNCQRLTQSINWGAWQQVGMAVEALEQRTSSKSPQTNQLLEDEISPAEGSESFQRIIQAGLPQVAVYPKDLSARMEQKEPLVTPGAEPSSPVPLQPRPGLSSVYVKPKNRIQSIIAEVWQEYLGIREIGINDNFFDLGATSLDIQHVNRRLNKILEMDIPVVTMYEYPTIHSLYQALGALDTRSDINSGEETPGGDREMGWKIEIQEGKQLLRQMLRKAKPGDN